MSDVETAGEDTPSRYDVVVVGAGQAGLAMGNLLARRGHRFVIFDRAASIGAAWRERWDSLTLFTPRRYDGLPGLEFPGDPDGYPHRDEVIRYLERYAETFELPIALESNVEKMTAEYDGFRLEVEGTDVRTDQVVVATGPFQTPYVPKLADELAGDVFQAHSTTYREPGGVPGARVLVVGGGNTGFQIAKELSWTHDVVLSVGSRQRPLPQRPLGRDLFSWLTTLRFFDVTSESRLGRRLRSRDTLIGSSSREVRRLGVELTSRAVAASGRVVRFEDGSEVEVDAVIWATGYRPDYAWIELPVFDADGRVRHRRGVTDIPGFYFVGLTWQHTRGSALLGWVKDDAEYIADRIDEMESRGSVTAPAVKGARAMAETTTEGAAHLPFETEGLPDATSTEVVELEDGDVFELEVAPVRKRIGDTVVRMLAYNGSVPGPTLRAPEGSKLTVRVTNRGDLEATVHWHGIRLENRYDGTHETQAPIPVGEKFTYEVELPDPGAYWYHPHIREDYGQELGLYGNLLVVPADPEYWPPAHRELLLTLDDVLIEDGRIAAFSESETTHVAMGRFGNVMLVAGEAELALEARRGEVVRLFLTNTANTRVFNVTLPGARLKLVGSDSGRYEHEAFVDEVLIAPSERYVVDVLFEEPGELALEHRTPERTYLLARITVLDEPAEPSLADGFGELRTSADLAAERERIAPYLDAPPDKTLAFVAEMELEAPEGPVVYFCPMHREVVSDEPGKCPKCGMKLLATAASYACPMHPEVTSDTPDHCPKCGMKLVPAQLVAASEHGHGHEHETQVHSGHGEDRHDHHAHDAAQGIEWEDDMVEVNRLTTPANTRWKLVDRGTGAANAAIDWTFQVGDQVKIRLVNELESDHPMPHPFHVHGAGRFLILARNGEVERNLAWKDTVLVRTGETVDILLDVTHPGIWMAHCHIAEHHESGMMLTFTVTD